MNDTSRLTALLAQVAIAVRVVDFVVRTLAFVGAYSLFVLVLNVLYQFFQLIIVVEILRFKPTFQCWILAKEVAKMLESLAAILF